MFLVVSFFLLFIVTNLYCYA